MIERFGELRNTALLVSVFVIAGCGGGGGGGCGGLAAPLSLSLTAALGSMYTGPAPPERPKRGPRLGLAT